MVDRVCQQALRQVLEPIFESTFSEVSFGGAVFRQTVEAEVGENISLEAVEVAFFRIDSKLNDIKVVDQQGREFERPQGTGVALCRCGDSANKPFCDGSHKSVGFESDDPAPRKNPV